VARSSGQGDDDDRSVAAKKVAQQAGPGVSAASVDAKIRQARFDRFLSRVFAKREQSAVTLLTDLQALAEREDRYDTFTLRTITVRQTHARKPSLIERLNQAGI
jgi:hypothetical protein